jgi:hypothetical protein
MSNGTNDREERQKQLRENERLRLLGERTEGDLTRSEGDLTRTEGDLSRTEGDLTRTEGDLTRDGADVGPQYVAADIFRKATALGGHLVVAFVAPVAATSPRSRFGGGLRSPQHDAEVAAARALLRRLIEQVANPTETPARRKPGDSARQQATTRPRYPPPTASQGTLD